MPNVDSTWLKTKELLNYHYGCHSNLVTIAARCVADAYHPKKGPYQIHLKQRSYKVDVTISN